MIMHCCICLHLSEISDSVIMAIIDAVLCWRNMLIHEQRLECLKFFKPDGVLNRHISR